MSGSTRNVSASAVEVVEHRILSTIDIADEPTKFAGAPIALQLVGKHFRDEETIAAAELLSRVVLN